MRIPYSALKTDVKKNWELYLLSLPAFAFFIIFQYVPMYGVQIAFKNFRAVDGIMGSPWVGLEHFIRFFRSYNFRQVLQNTIGLSLYQLTAGFPVPIILALMINEVKNSKFRKAVQVVSYAPHFVSTVVVVGIINVLLSQETGVLNKIILKMGGQALPFLTEPSFFKTIYVISGIWAGAGWGSIIYFAALSAVDVQLYEAAAMDGATKLQKILNIDIPSILPTMVVMLILRAGQIMTVGFEKALLMQNSLNISASEIISTYTYRVGLVNANYSFSAAVGLFNSLSNFILLILVNRIARAINETSLW
jgi:putative aldouronate transport system permease protein